MLALLPLMLLLSTVHCSTLNRFNRSELNLERFVCYSQILFDPLLRRTTGRRCSPAQTDCINTILLPVRNSSTNLQQDDPNRMLILVCSKLNAVDQITLSLNLNGQIFDSSFSFTLKPDRCLDCSDNLVEQTDSWPENRNSRCSAFKFRINQPFNESKEILYIDRVGYYLTVQTRSTDGALHQASTDSFAYPQSPTVRSRINRPCEERNSCLFFRGQNVSERCTKENDCTGRVMSYRLQRPNDRLVSIFRRKFSWL